MPAMELSKAKEVWGAWSERFGRRAHEEYHSMQTVIETH